MPAIGTLTDRVQVQRKMMAPDPGGGHATSFVPFGATWARVRSLSARTAMATDARTAEASHSVVMRFRSDIGAGDRVIYRGRALEIIGTRDMNGRRAYLACTCRETEAIA